MLNQSHVATVEGKAAKPYDLRQHKQFIWFVHSRCAVQLLISLFMLVCAVVAVSNETVAFVDLVAGATLSSGKGAFVVGPVMDFADSAACVCMNRVFHHCFSASCT